MRKADNLPPYRAVVMKSGSLNFLEPSGPAQACYGRTLLFTCPVSYSATQFVINVEKFTNIFTVMLGHLILDT